MRRIFISPRKYVQGPGELKKLAEHILPFGKVALLIASEEDRQRVQDILDEALKNQPVTVINGNFTLECTTEEIERQKQIAIEKNVDVIIGLGGGKSLDTAKACGFEAKKPTIIIPTIASTDAPTSSLAVIYKTNGQFDKYYFFQKNPDLVLLDSEIIAKAPVRFLVAGMGDALATYFEARQCIKSFADNVPGGKSTLAAAAIAKLCYDTLLQDSLKAKIACEQKVPTLALENIIEANTLLSGLGFESCGLAVAHAVHNGLTALEECHHYYHGEKVAFGLIVQLIIENAPQEEIDTVLKYCWSVGLPTCLADLGVKQIDKKKIMEVAEIATKPGESIHNMPFKCTPDVVYWGIIAADKIGKH